MLRDQNDLSVMNRDDKEAFVNSDSFQYCINLMWLNDKKNTNGEYVCKNIDYVLLQLTKWQASNPKAEINFWYDSKYTNVSAIKKTLQLLTENPIDQNKTIQFRDIREIPIVRQNIGLFSIDIPVYFRVDILKLIICLHTMLSDGMHSAIFSDFSIADQVESTLTKSELFSPDSLKSLDQFGLLIGFDGEKIENQFIQTINSPELIQALIHAINCSIFISANTLNNLITEEFNEDDNVFMKKRAAAHITTMPFYAAQSYIYIYLLSVAHPEGIKIRADIVNEGNKNEWVKYDPEKHGFMMFGNHFKYNTLDTIYYNPESKQSFLTKDFIKLPDSLHINPTFKNYIKTFNNANCHVRTDEVVRYDLHPGHFGSSHEWSGNFSYQEMEYTLLPFNSEAYFSQDDARQDKKKMQKPIESPSEFLFQSESDECEMVYRFSKEKNEQALDTLIAHGYQPDLSSIGDNPILLLAKDGDLESLQFLIEKLKITPQQAIIAYAFGNFEDQVSEVIIKYPNFTQQAIYGYALGNNTEKVDAMLNRNPSNASSAIEAYAIIGQVEKVDTLCKKYSWHINKAVKGYVISDRLEPLLALQNNQLVAELCGKYGKQLLFDNYCKQMKLYDNKVAYLKQIYDFHRKEKKIFLLHNLSDRIFTIISLQNDVNDKKYRFYHSGLSSDDYPPYRKTWFPMRNCLPNGYIEKPGDICSYQYPYTEFYPKQLVDFLTSSSSVKFFNCQDENNISEIFSRFGNFDCMCISYLIGGGYWDNPDSEDLRNFLEEKFQPKMQEIINAIQNFDLIQNINTRNIPKNNKFNMIQLPYALSKFCSIDENIDYKNHFVFSQNANPILPDIVDIHPITQDDQMILMTHELSGNNQNETVGNVPDMTHELYSSCPSSDTLNDDSENSDELSYTDTSSDSLMESSMSQTDIDHPLKKENSMALSKKELKEELDNRNMIFNENKSHPSAIARLFGLKKTEIWQKNSSEMRKKAWDLLIKQLPNLEDNAKIEIIKHAKTLSIFNKHTSNYTLTKNTDYPLVFNMLDELQKEFEQKKEPELIIKLKLK